MIQSKSEYTFKHNINLRRHGWLRLTPAYSVKLVEDIIGRNDLFSDKKITEGEIFDPFCGTATTGIVAAEHGLKSSLYEINPFLHWFSTVKSSNYTSSNLENLLLNLKQNLFSNKYSEYNRSWIPPMKNIERWWSPETSNHLGKLHEFIKDSYGVPTLRNSESNLIWVAFARLIIECSSADFGHISVSFKNESKSFEEDAIIKMFLSIADTIFDSAKQKFPVNAVIINGDSRNVSLSHKVNYVITSPPYPNRISYIRELRPYMYWLGFLKSGEEAGELDWSAIGGTWGSATSKLSSWECADWDMPVCLKKTIDAIRVSDSKNGKILSKYVLKFFYDIYLHFKNLSKNLENGCELYYILGNSSFYGIMVHTDAIVCDIMASLGYARPNAKVIRKRNSKKELFEFLITAQWVENKNI